MPEAVIHPTPEELTAFGLGKMPEQAATVIATHLESCPTCRQAVAAVTPDSFLDKVRAAGPAGSSFPPSLARPGDPPSSAGKPAIPTVPCPNVPPELARHPKYLILRELGRGGMGVVYQARQTMMDRQVVIKVINRALIEQPGALERFHREIRAAAQLSHPNIVTAYDAEQAGELHMLVMEFVPGQSLSEVLEKKGPLPVVNACHYMRQVALGLKHADERGMVHRDIKPSNLIVMPKGQVKILDFGLAKVISERNQDLALTSDNHYMGTPDYCSPEQAQNARTADIRADLYSLGCTLYCLLAGRPPFCEDTPVSTILAHVQKQPQPLPELRPNVPAELWQVVKRLLAKDPGKRYQKPIEVFQALSVFVKPGAKLDAKSVSLQVPSAVSPVKGTRIDADESKIKKILREVPAKTPPKKAPAKEKPSASVDLVDTPSLPDRTERARESAKPVPGLWSRCWPALAAAGLLLLLVLLGTWASGVFKAKVKTADGEAFIVLENLPVDAEVRVDGEIVTVAAVDGKSFEIRVDPRKKHRLQVKKDGFKIFGEEVELDAGGRKSVVVRLERKDRPPEPPKAKHENEKPKAIAEEKGQWVSLFNGKDLTGWKVFGGGTGNWKVAEGAIVGSGPMSHLFSEHGDYENFHYRVEAMINDGGNSGQCFRTEFAPDFPKGYEAQINSTHGDPIRTGSLYPFFGTLSNEERESIIVKDRLVQPNEWFTQEVIADGNHIVIMVNGKTTVDFADDKNTYKKGHFALQQHGPTTVVKFRKIEIKELPPKVENKDGARFQGSAEEWIREVRALPAKQQVERVAAKLKERNPGFDGAVKPTIENEVVTGLWFVTDHVTDLRPLRALPGLKRLAFGGSTPDKGKLADLSALEGMNLTQLYCGWNNRLSDLSPLKGLPLTILSCAHTQVSDLSPLEGMSLTELYCGGTKVSDLSPLKGMPLTKLGCAMTKVSDLLPVKGKQLTLLNCWDTAISDLSPLQGMPLVELHCQNTKVSDLSPLKGMPLKILECDFRPERDTQILRSIQTLEKINDKPAAELLKTADVYVRPLKVKNTYKNRFGNWKIEGDKLLQDMPQVDCQLVFGDFAWKDYDFACEAKSVGANAGIGLLYHVTGSGWGQFIAHKHPDGWSRTMDFAESVERGNYAQLGRRETDRLELKKDRWYKLAVSLKGAHCQCFLDEKLVFEYDDAKNSHGAVGLLASGPVCFRKIRVMNPAGKVLFERLPKLPAAEGQWLPATEASSASELVCIKGHNAPVTCVAFTRSGRLLSCSNGNISGPAAEDNGVNGAAGSFGSTIRLWGGETGKELDRSPLIQNPAWKNWGFVKLAVSPDGTHLLSSSAVNAGRGIQLWGTNGGKIKPLSYLKWIERFGVPSGSWLSFTPDGRKALAVSDTGSLWEWNVNDAKLVRELPGTLQDVSCVAIAPNGKTALLARRNQSFAEIELSTGKQTGRWKEAVGVVRSMTFTSDSKQLLTGGRDGDVRLWDVESGKQIGLVGRHERPVLAVAFSPKGKRALSGSEDHTVRLWDLDTEKKELACFTGHTGGVNSVAFSPDGRRAASGSADYTVRLWRLPPTKP